MISTLSREQIVTKLAQLAADQVAVDPAGLTEETHLVNDLNFDSLDSVEFVMTIEDNFDVSIPDDEADKVRTIGQAADILCVASPTSQAR